MNQITKDRYRPENPARLINVRHVLLLNLMYYDENSKSDLLPATGNCHDGRM